MAGRNQPCPCGSGRRHKRCCGAIAAADSTARDGLAALLALWRSARYEELEHSAHELLRTTPQSGEAWQLLAMALVQQKRDAVQAWRKAAKLRPDDPVVHLGLGNELGRRGQLTQAQDCFRRTLALSPGLAEAHNNLAEVQLELGQLEDAEANCRHAIGSRPNFTQAHITLGQVLLREGRAVESLQSCRRALTLSPASAAAHNCQGNALLKLSRVGEALDSFRQALALSPDYLEAQMNLANAQRSAGRLDEAIENYRTVARARPEFAAAHAELGMALRLQRRTAEAEASCTHALALDPRSMTALLALAELHADCGNFDEAQRCFDRILALDPRSTDAWAGIVRLRRMTPADASWLAAVEKLVLTPRPPGQEMLLRFALGKYFDDLGEYQQAFSHYERANRLAKTRGPSHDRAELSRVVDLLIRTVDRSWIARALKSVDRRPRPVLIVGMPRSGTTLVEHILAAHPAVFGAGEQSFWGRQWGSTLNRSAARAEVELQVPDAVLQDSGTRYLQLLRELSADAATVVDKFPANFLFLGLIHAALPDARIIHLQRNALDTALSIYFQQFEAANTYANDLEDIGHYHADYQRLMQHWRQVLPPGVMLEVPYEELCANPTAWTRRMLNFLSLPWDESCVDFQKTDRPVVTASRWQVRQRISSRSIERWRHYEQFLGPLKTVFNTDRR